MNTTNAFSGVLRLVAATAALTAILLQHPSARAAAPFQAPLLIPVPNLSAYWNLDETSGTTPADSSGNNHNGVFYNSPTISAAGDVSPVPTPGNLRSLIFNASGSTQRVNVNDAAGLRISGPITVSAWVKPTMDTPTYQKGVLEKWTDGASDIDGYMFRLGWSNAGNNVPTFSLGNGVTRVSVATGAPLTNGQWTHIAGVYDGSQLLIYVNGGAPVATTPNSGAGAVVPTAANTRELHLGSDYGTEVFTGNIDEPRIYNRGLTQAEVQILHDGQPAPTGLVATGGFQQNDLTWTAAAGAATYSVRRGTSSGNFTTLFNGITGTTFADTTATPGVAYFYVVVAVSVMTSANSNEQSATASSTPPPPPPPPRTAKVGNENNPCGCGTVPAANGRLAALGFLLLLGAWIPFSVRRG